MKTLRTNVIYCAGAICFLLFTGSVYRGVAQNTFPSSGHAGVGTSSPEQLFDIYSAGADPYTMLQIRANRSGYGNIRGRIEVYAGGSTTTDKMFFGTDSSTASARMLTLRGDGNVGIGTASPNRNLVVATAGQSTLQVTDTSFGSSASDGFQIQQAGADTNLLNYENGFIALFTNVTERMRILAGGNVGIGTTSPSAVLEVRKASGEGLRVSSGNAAAHTYLSVGRTGEDALFGVAGATNHFWTGTVQGDAVLKMNTSAKLHVGSNQSTPEITFSAGNVGIGTTSPGTKLDVAGTVYTNNQTLLLWNVGRTLSSSTGIESQASGGLEIGTNAGGPLTLYTGTVERLRINSSGYVGIGTPSPTEKLHVAGNGKFTGNLVVDGNIAAKYQDVAEWVESSEQLSAGTVVVLDSTKSNQVIASSQSYDTRVAGVISAQPGIALGEKSDSKVLVATTGRVKIKVDATKSPIQIGDLLVTSDVPGVAMKSEAVNLGGVQFHRPGTLIGKALEPLAKGKGEILILLSLQ